MCVCLQRRLGPCCQKIISEPQQRVSGLRVRRLSPVVPRSGDCPPERLCCKADPVFLDRVSLVLSGHLFLVVSVTLKLVYFPFPFVFRVVLQPAPVRWGGVLPGEQAAALSPETWLLLGLRQALCWFAWVFHHI